MVLLTRNQASNPTRVTTMIWKAHPRMTGSFHGATLTFGAEPSVSTAMRFPLRGSADQRRGLQAALRPRLVDAAVACQRSLVHHASHLLPCPKSRLRRAC